MIAVGMDAGFDGGAAAWVLDLTGCVATAGDESAALADLPHRVRRYRHWAGEVGPLEGFEVVERIETRVLDDGYEINATFEADRAAIDPDGLRAGQRLVDAAHRRFLRAARATPGGALRGEGSRDEPMIRHVVRAGIWIASRTEPNPRGIAFPPEETPIHQRVDDGFAFIDQYVERMLDGDGVRERVDSKGEEWTVRKVLRRLVYHALDHAEQLERGEMRD
jgi:hypothetical protein